jgi:hypothetical protein
LISTQLRPRSATEIVDAAFQLMRGHFVSLITLSIAAILPLAAVLVLVGVFGGFPRAGTSADSGAAVGAALFIVAIFIIVFLVGQNAVMAAASQAYLGEAVQAGEAVRRALRRTLPLILVYAVSVVGIFAGFLLFIIPGVYLAIRLLALPMVTVLEDGDPIETFKRTWDLGRGHAGHMFITSLIGNLMYTAVSFIGQIGMTLVTSLLPGAAAASLGLILLLLTFALAFPFVQVIRVVLYYDLRIRLEGLDVEMMAEALGEPAVQA